MTKRKVYLALAAALIGAAIAGTAYAGQTQERTGPTAAIFQAVPADAWGVVAIRNVGELDQKLMAMGQATNNPAAAAGMGILMVAKMALGIGSGIDENGGVAMVLMPTESLEAFEQSTAVLIPTSNYTELIGWMEPEDIGDGFSKMLFQGSPTYVAQKGGFAVMGPSIEAVKRILQGQGSFMANLTEHQLERLGRDDLTAWGNAAAALASPMVSEMLAGLKEQGLGPELFSDFKSLQLSLRFDPAGITLGIYSDAKPGSVLAKMYADMKQPAEPLLAGLPADSYVLAVGSVTGTEAMQTAMDMMGKSMIEMAPQAPPEAAGVLSTCIDGCKKLLAPVRTLAAGVNTLPEGPDGLLGGTLLLSVDGGASSYLATIKDVIGTIKEGVPAEHAGSAAQAVVYKAGAEGDNVDHLIIDPAGMGASEKDLGIMTKIVGSEGLLVRFAAVDDKHVAVTLGGGEAYHNTVVDLVKNDRAPLADNAGIQKVGHSMPENRASEMYISPDGAMNLVNSLAKAFDEDVPFKLGAVDVPVAMCKTFLPGGGAQADVFIPVELLKAATEVMLGAMGGAAGGPGGSPPM